MAKRKFQYGGKNLYWERNDIVHSYQLECEYYLKIINHDTDQIGDAHKIKNIRDHGQGWGNSMDWKLLGDYLPE